MMTALKKNYSAALLFGVAAGILGALASGARAQDARPQHGPHRPPPEAFSACQGKSEGAACSVTFHERTLEGTCVAPSSEQLFCMPNDMPPPPSGDRPEPPPRRSEL